MSIPVDRVYQTVLMFANSDIRGNVKPRELTLAINDIVNQIYEGYFAEINRGVNRENRGMINGGLENIPDRIRERLLHFLTFDETLVYNAPVFNLPDDYRYIDTITSGDYVIEPCKTSAEFKAITNYIDTRPTATSPIYLKIGDTIKVSPSTIVSGVLITYLRKPILANWTYTMVNGAEVFNPSAADFRDIDMHPGEENNIVIGVLNRFGINLKEQDLVAFTERNNAQDFNQDNAV